MEWRIGSFELCRKSVSFCYGFSENKFRLASAKYDAKSSTQLPLNKSRDWNDSTFFDDLDFDAIEEIFEGNGLATSDRDMMQA
jgi:hypothetical protein